jgi:hypothetical protein
VWGEQGFLLRGLVISPTKLTNCSLVSIEDTGSAVSDIMDSNGCSQVNAAMALSPWVFTKGISVGVRRTRISPQGLDYPACQAYSLFFTIDGGLCAAASHIMDSNRCSGFTKDG